jgi:hypothetical protein
MQVPEQPAFIQCPPGSMTFWKSTIECTIGRKVILADGTELNDE